MKKLIIRDHLMNIVLEKDVYMEGQDFIYIAPAPECIWLKELYICSPEDTEKFVLTEQEVAERKPKPEPEPELVAMIPLNPVRCRSCGWEGDTKDCQFGHDDFYCPECDKEDLESKMGAEPGDMQDDGEFELISEGEVTSDEPETAINPSVGNEGASEAKQPSSPETTPEKPAKRKAAKRGK